MIGRVGRGWRRRRNTVRTEDGSVLGRFNLVFAESGTATLGYRVAQHVAGRGVATATVRELCGTFLVGSAPEMLR